MGTHRRRSGVDWGFVVSLVLAAAIVLLFWGSPFVYPVRLFVTIVHEMGHAVAAVVTGGQVVSVSISPDASGVAWTRGGNGLITSSAGYLGSVLFGTLLLTLAKQGPWSRTLLAGLGGALLIAALLAIRNPFGLAVTIALAVGFIAMAAKSPQWLLSPAVYFLATLNCLYAVHDLAGLTFLSQTAVPTDAANMARMTGIPALFWALLWLILGLLALFLAGKRLVRR